MTRPGKTFHNYNSRQLASEFADLRAVQGITYTTYSLTLIILMPWAEIVFCGRRFDMVFNEKESV